jgi:hypothetical protein
MVEPEEQVRVVQPLQDKLEVAAAQVHMDAEVAVVAVV